MKSTLSPLSKSQKTIMGKAVALLQKRGYITNIDCFQLGTVDGRKMFTVMRRLGLLYKANSRKGHEDVPNKRGGGTHRKHFWTGKKLIGT